MSASPKTLIPDPNNSWTIVSNRRNRKNPKPKPYPNPNFMQNDTLTLKSPIPWAPTFSQSDPTLQSKIQFKFNSTFRKLKSSKFYSHFVQTLNSPQIQSGIDKLLTFCPKFHFIIYGIGSIDLYETPRLQLGLALLVYEHFKNHISLVEVFDPVITENECTIIESLGIKVMRVDESGRRQVKAPTLFYMPHCEVQLYDNLLDANWVCENLNSMVVLGNSFAEYGRYVEDGRGLGASVRVEEAGKRVIESRRFVKEVEVEGVEEGDDGYFRAFHDISWHFFDVGSDVDLEFV